MKFGTAVSAIDETGVQVGDERIDARCVIWAAGVQSSPAAKWIGASSDRAGRAVVGPGLRIEGRRNIFVIGDTASARDADGATLPGAIKGRMIAPFVYKDFGAMATIGRKSAIADFRGVHLKGSIGWLVWCLAHIYFLIGFRNRLAVAMDWIWSYLTFERGARLITGEGLTPDRSADQAREAA